jgi:hypothetical protein
MKYPNTIARTMTAAGIARRSKEEFKRKKTELGRI